MKTLIVAIFGYGLFEIIMNYWKLILFGICVIIGIWLFVEDDKKSDKDRDSISNNNSIPASNVIQHREQDLSSEELFQLGKQAYRNKNYREGGRLLMKAIEQGNSDAMLFWGEANILSTENYQSEDFKTGIRWIRMAVDKGNTEAMVILGKFYAEGKVDGLPNYQEAMNLYKRASDLGNMEARKELNTIYNKLNRFM